MFDKQGNFLKADYFLNNLVKKKKKEKKSQNKGLSSITFSTLASFIAANYSFLQPFIHAASIELSR